MHSGSKVPLLPSKETRVPWLWAERKTGTYHEDTENSGKWLLFVSNSDVDETWTKIKAATEQGLLGPSAKVATAKPNPYAVHKDKKVICIYTYDWTDALDVMRVREHLRTLGIRDKIPYKANSDTRAGNYSNQVRRISKYNE
jgi:hypothetical protein